jgi:hypothetical protein
MADIKHTHATPAAPTEGDGINYRGILWFMVILTVTTVVCQVLMWGTLKFFIEDADKNDAARAPMAAPMATPALVCDNMVVPGPGGTMPPPYLQTREPLGLESFRASEDEILTKYGWVDKNEGIVRIPVERAKALLLERGIPGGKPMAPGAAVPGAAGVVPAAAAAPAPAKAPVKIKKD